MHVTWLPDSWWTGVHGSNTECCIFEVVCVIRTFKANILHQSQKFYGASSHAIQVKQIVIYFFYKKQHSGMFCWFYVNQLQFILSNLNFDFHCNRGYHGKPRHSFKGLLCVFCLRVRKWCSSSPPAHVHHSSPSRQTDQKLWAWPDRPQAGSGHSHRHYSGCKCKSRLHHASQTHNFFASGTLLCVAGHRVCSSLFQTMVKANKYFLEKIYRKKEEEKSCCFLAKFVWGRRELSFKRCKVVRLVICETIAPPPQADLQWPLSQKILTIQL